MRKNIVSEPEYSGLLLVAVLKHQPKLSREERDFGLHFLIIVHHWENLGRNSRQKSLGKIWSRHNGGALLTRLLPSMFAKYIIQSLSTFPVSTSINRKKNALQTRPQVSLMGSNSSAKVLTSQLSPVCVKLIKKYKRIKKTNHHKWIK